MVTVVFKRGLQTSQGFLNDIKSKAPMHSSCNELLLIDKLVRHEAEIFAKIKELLCGHW